MATGAVPVRIRTAISLFVENSHLETRHQGVMFRSPRAFVGSTATLRYEPCTQVSLSQIPPKNDFRTKKILNQEFLYEISSFCTLSENNSLLHGNISCFCIFLAKMAFLIQTELPEWQTATLRNELCFRSFQYVKKAYSRMPFRNNPL